MKGYSPEHGPTTEQWKAGQQHAEAWLRGLNAKALARLSDHDRRALAEGIAWALYRQGAGISHDAQLPKANGGTP